MRRFSWVSVRLSTVWLAALATAHAAGFAEAGTAARNTTGGAAEASAAGFRPLIALPAAKIIRSAAQYPTGNLAAGNLVDDNVQSEYATASKGTDTFIDFDFGKPTPIAGFRHVDRRDPATVDTAELVFSDRSDFSRVIATVEVKHANTRGGTTIVPFQPITARYVKWRVTAVKSYTTVGGAEIGFFAAGEPDSAPVHTTLEATAFPALLKKEGKLWLPIRATVRYPYDKPAQGTLEVTGGGTQTLELQLGSQTVETTVPAVKSETPIRMTLKVGGRTVAQHRMTLRPVRRWEMYLLPHSHVDIGYTHVQTEVEQRQWKHLEQAIEIARKTADYPPASRFKWNAEVLWAVDSYLKQASEQKREEFLEAVRKGQIHLDGLYGNELTALCRPEELLWLPDLCRRLRKRYDLPLQAAMISDVPGYTWGLVPVMAQSGIKYLSIGPNHGHRIGRTLSEWGDRPYYWVSPSGQEKVLCWMAGKAYSWFHGGRMGTVSQVKPPAFFDYLNELSESGYPYDIVQVRYSIGGDNGPPDPELPDWVRQWNAKYAYPKLIIATTSEMFHEFERRYGEEVPEVRGDFTPYWEDGAGSSSRETGINRAAAERLVQAQALWAMLRPRQYPDEKFYAAWRNLILYDEHTWGAHCSISQPDSDFTRSQWKIKQDFAMDAQKQSQALLEAALATRSRKAANR